MQTNSNKIDPFDRNYDTVPLTEQNYKPEASTMVLNTATVTMDPSQGSDAPSTFHDEVTGLKGRWSFIIMFACL